MQTLKKLAVTIGLLALSLSLRAQPVPVKVGSLVQVATAPPNSVLLITIPGVTNYIITFQNVINQLSLSFGTNNVVISNAYLTTLTVISNTTVNYFIATNLSQFQSNIQVAATNFSSWLVVTNSAFIGGNIYVSGDGNFYNIYVTNNAFIGNQLTVSNSFATPFKTNQFMEGWVDADTYGRAYWVVDNAGRSSWIAEGQDPAYGGGYFSAIGSQESAINLWATNQLPANVYMRWCARSNYVALDRLNPGNLSQIAATPVSIFNGAPDNSLLVNSNGSTFVNYGLFMTNRTVTVATNADVANLDYSIPPDWYEVPVFYKTNIFLYLTNLVAGRELWTFFGPTTCDVTVTVTNAGGYVIHWNRNSPTNGGFSFVVTNGTTAELAILCRSNNIIHAVYGQGL